MWDIVTLLVILSIINTALAQNDSLCLDPGQPRYGLRTPVKRFYQHNETVTFQCNAGYTMIGKSVLTCQRDGTWNGYQPMCLAPCPDPGVPSYAVRLSDNFKHGQTVRFGCKKKYKIKGSSFISCVDGEWNNKTPKCSAVYKGWFSGWFFGKTNPKCEDPGKPVHGERTPYKKKYQHNEVVTFRCNSQLYEMIGKSVLTCQRDGTWDGYQPTCLAKCFSPGVPRHGVRLDNNFKHGQTVRFRCQKGYNFEGSSFLSCINGEWKNKPPRCTVPCSDPGIPLNGKRLDHSFNHNGVVRFACNKGFNMDGVDNIRCINGQWDHNAPKCFYDDCGKVEMTNKPPRIIGMWPWQVFIKAKKIQSVSSDWTTVCGGALITPQWVLTAAHCVSNTSVFVRPSKVKYKIVAGHPEIRSIEPTGQERTPLEIHIHPGFLYGLFYPINDIALIKLNRRVTLGTYVRTVCLPDTKENLTKLGTVGSAPHWEITGNLAILRHLSYKIEDRATAVELFAPITSNGKTLGVPCYGDSGSSMVKNVLVNGRYRFVTIGLLSFAGCKTASRYALRRYYTRTKAYMDWILYKTNSLCLDPGQPRNGLRTLLKKVYQHDETVTFQCNAGYTMIGKSVLTCQPNGTWNGYQPLCLASCRSPDIPKDGYYIRFGSGNFEHGHNLWFRCKKGYKLHGAFFMHCINGQWDKTTPKCIELTPKDIGNMPSTCQDPGQPRYGLRTPVKRSYQHNDAVTFQCNAGYTMIGKSVLTCQQDGTWNGYQPSCLAPCSNPGVPSHAVRLGNDFKHGRTVRFRCKKRYTLEGSSFIHCHNGRWINKTPKCAAPCPDPGIVTGGLRMTNDTYNPNSASKVKFGCFGCFNHNSVVTFTCQSRIFRMDGVNTIRCNDGRWDNNVPRCLPNFQIIGCFRDLREEPRPFSILIGHFGNHGVTTPNRDEINEIITACAVAAVHMRIYVIGIDENGECWGTIADKDTYSRNGPSTDCHHGVGKWGSVMVYKLDIETVCFPANAVVKLKTGAMATMETLRIGDEVQTLDSSTNETFYTEVITFLHNEKSQGLYRVIEADDGNKLLISHEHLIYSGKTKDAMDMIYAEKIQPGDFVLSGNRSSKVISVKTVYDRGLYAPMTRHGTMLVNGIYVSCYAHHDSQELVHSLMAPLRLWYDVSNFVRDVVASIGMKLAINDGPTGNEIPQGIHGYIRFLKALSKYLP